MMELRSVRSTPTQYSGIHAFHLFGSAQALLKSRCGRLTVLCHAIPNATYHWFRVLPLTHLDFATPLDILTLPVHRSTVTSYQLSYDGAFA